MANAPAKFTPGPWEIERPFDKEDFAAVVAMDPDPVVIADLPGSSPYSDGEGPANANLIAAAPELLAACKAIVVRLPPAFADNIAQLNAAIQKAEGRNSPCSACGDETCAHGGCGDPRCRYFCTRCQRERDAAREAAFQRDVAGPLLGLDEEGNRG